MRRDSQRLFECIQFLRSVKVLYIQIKEIVIVNEIQTVASALLARWVYRVNPECCCLNSNTLLHTHYIYIYIYIYYVWVIILTILRPMIYIFLVFFVKHASVDPIQPYESFTMSVKCLSLKCLSKIITFHISCWLVENSVDASDFESVSYIKVSNVKVFFSA